MTKIRQYLENSILAARDAIYKLGAPIKGVVPERWLKTLSLVPTLNAFADALGPLGFNVFPMLVVDLLHEFELGIFKSVFKHLIRLLYAINPGLVAALNKRFRQIPSFGKGVIRRFPPNVVEARQRAARHFEDVLQCAIPAFEGLFPSEHEPIVRTLLFRLAQWHALAKLRLHTDDSLLLLDKATRLVGYQMRKFQEFTCAAFKTMELPSETAARRRRKEGKNVGVGPSATTGTTARPKTFNLLTYKFHALGDYVNTIRLFGTSDSYTTQIGELSHRLLKKFYQSTNKQDPTRQLAKQERWHTRARRQLEARFDPDENLRNTDTPLPPELHHKLSDSPCNAINLAEFLSNHLGDPSVKDFIPKLKDHLLSRLLNHEYDGDEQSYTSEERNSICFVNGLNRVFRPKRFQINYTTYDIRRDQDTLRPGHGAAVMVLSREQGPDAHPFWYAQVLGAFLIKVHYAGVEQTMDFLWVRWFGVVPGYRWGIQKARLPKIGFIPDSPAAFGFLDPSLVIRACHLIPAFAAGRTDSLLRRGPSAARAANEADDWTAYYVNIFADRDMFARFAGIGVGHSAQYTLQVAFNQEACDEIDADHGEPDPTHSNTSNSNSDPGRQSIRGGDRDRDGTDEEGLLGPETSDSDDAEGDDSGIEDSDEYDLDEDASESDLGTDEDDDGPDFIF
ncbi:hypothetical protein HYDPIDRAFT_33994 [Hydnomerulius pinastri MD-312]|uniref:Uncharacterized protein n=1 Tax=Hydnomerulius pinastri MD-312 TaxID=994086 RepID=A0A0C9W732_9AGAM|nr:hypothetical protein HYDPIDRAFT_33994 [Hydnomerulius pinastri MD-312]